MLNFNHLIFVCVLTISVGCQTDKNEIESPISTAPQIVSSEIQLYNITDSLVVNSVEAILFNSGNAKNYLFIVELFQGEQHWSDTIVYYALENDTARHHIIFAESIYSKENPAAFTSKIVPVASKNQENVR